MLDLRRQGCDVGGRLVASGNDVVVVGVRLRRGLVLLVPLELRARLAPGLADEAVDLALLDVAAQQLVDLGLRVGALRARLGSCASLGRALPCGSVGGALSSLSDSVGHARPPFPATAGIARQEPQPRWVRRMISGSCGPI